MKYLGLDGCKAGWFLVGLNEDQTGSFGILATIEELSPHLAEADLALLDVPIGLRQRDPAERRCDKDARKVLGRRSSSVFPAPSRCVLECSTYAEANALNKECTGRGLSQQSWAIVPKIREVDSYLRSQPVGGKVREMHPEVCFWALNNEQPMDHNKKTDEGFEERMVLLERWHPGARNVVKAAMAKYPRKQLARDDVVDALCGAITASKSAQLRTIPEPVETDDVGLPMEVVYWVPS